MTILIDWVRIILGLTSKTCQWSDINSTGFGSTTSRVCTYGKDRVCLFQHNDGLYYPSFMDNTPEHPNHSFEDLEEAKKFVENYLTQPK